jgi:hypothetical protein
MGGKILKESEGIGLVFGRLTVMGWAGRDSRNHQLWRCICSCGAECALEMYPLKKGQVKSCGCYKVDTAGVQSITHGAASRSSDPEVTRIFRVWTKIRSRCLNSRDRAYQDYGGRGITICESWMNFSNFYRDMGHPSAGLTVERLDVNKGYEPGNCIWLPLNKQNENKRNTIRVSYNGKVWCLKRLCEHLGVPYTRTYKRLKRNQTAAAAFGLEESANINLIATELQDVNYTQ